MSNNIDEDLEPIINCQTSNCVIDRIKNIGNKEKAISTLQSAEKSLQYELATIKPENFEAKKVGADLEIDRVKRKIGNIKLAIDSLNKPKGWFGGKKSNKKRKSKRKSRKARKSRKSRK